MIWKLRRLKHLGVRIIALFTVNFSHLHYNIFERGLEAISGKKCNIARNCLTSTFKNIVMQMRKGNREKGYYLRLTEGRLHLPPYNNSTNMPTRMVSNSACFYVGKRLSLSTSAVQRVFKRNKRKFLSHNITSAVKCRRHHHLSWVRLPKLPGPERRKERRKESTLKSAK